MKTKKRLLMFCGLVCALMLSISLSIGVMFAGTEPVLTLNGELQETYNMGAEIEIPQGKIEVGGTEVVADAILVYPNDTAYVASSDKVTLTSEGVYTVQYRATIGGKLYVESKNFTVKSSLYGHTAATTVTTNMTYKASEHNAAQMPYTGGEVTGLGVSLGGGDTFRYNKVIDLNTLTKNDSILKFAITPAAIGTPDTYSLFMYLTDAHDPENVVTVKLRQEGDLRYSNIYMSVAAPGQPLTGHQWNQGVLHTGGNYGMPFRANFAGYFPTVSGGQTMQSPDLSKVQENLCGISMNYAEREFHCTSKTASANTLVADLDSTADYSVLWDGFTTGEVFVSVSCASTFNFVVTEIAGRDLLDTNFGERVAPSILVDYEGYSESALPNAVVGKPYPLFDAIARSPYDGLLSVETRIFRNFGEENAYELYAENGIFTPTEAGQYYIVYDAYDNFDRLGRKVVPITAIANPADIVLTHDANSQKTGIAGYPVTLLDPTYINNQGFVDIVATYEVDGAEPVVINNKQFTPTKAGDYKIVLKATDYVSRTGSDEYTVVVGAGTKPVFEKEPTLPEAFIAGRDYVLPQIEAYNFTDGSGAKVPVSIVAKTKATETPVRGGKFTPVATENGQKVTIKYLASLESGINEWSKEIPIVLPEDEEGNLRLERFLIKTGNGVTDIVAEEKYTTISFANSTSGVIWANPLLASSLKIEFSSGDLSNNYDGVRITLTDSMDKSQAVTFTYTRHAKGAEVALNGNMEEGKTRFATQFFNNAENKFSLTYDALEKAVVYDPFSSDMFPIEKTLSGEEFNGFESGKVYVKLEMVGVRKATKLILNSLQGQRIDNSSEEYLGPRISVLGAYGGTSDYGTVVTLNKAVVADAVDPSAKAMLTVRMPDNSFAVAEGGILLRDAAGEKEYQLKLTQFGIYRISYTSEDVYGNVALTFTYVITVPDTAKPEIIVEKEIVKTGKVGSAIEIPNFTVSDNVSTEDAIICGVMFIDSTGQTTVVDLEQNRGFIPNRAGKYIIRYYAYDEEGNFTLVDYVITVTE